MKDFAVNLIRLLLSFIILLFSEEYFYKFSLLYYDKSFVFCSQ